MARQTDSLVELIKHFTSSEKRYFKRHASIHRIGDANTYVKLFDFIAKEQHCSDERIKKAFNGSAFLNRLSISKTRLYNQLLHSLVLFHSSQDVETSIWRKAQAAGILLDKNLTGQALSLLSQAKKLAQRYEKHELVLFIINKELPIINRFSEDKSKVKYRKQLYQETEASLGFIRINSLHEQLIQSLEAWMFNTKKSFPAGVKSLLNELSSIPLYDGAGPKIRLALNDALLMQTILQGSHQDAFAKIYQSLGIIRNHPKCNLKEWKVRLHLIGGLIALELKNKLAFQDHYNSLCLLQHQLKKDHEERQIVAQNSLYYLELKEENRRQHFINNPAVLQSAWEYWNNHKLHIPVSLSSGLGLLLSGVFFELELYRRAKATIALVEEISNPQCKEDIYLNSQLQRIMLGIQLNDEPYTRHLIRQTKRHIHVSTNAFPDFSLVLSKLTEINKCQKYFERSEKFESLYNLLVSKEPNSMHSDLIGLLVNWSFNQSKGNKNRTITHSIAL